MDNRGIRSWKLIIVSVENKNIFFQNMSEKLFEYNTTKKY